MDDFADNVVDQSKWAVGALTRGLPTNRHGMHVSEEHGRFHVTSARMKMPSFNGYVSAKTWSIRDGVAVVKVVDVLRGSGITSFSLVRDETNWYQFSVHDGTLRYSCTTHGEPNSVEVPYQPKEYRFWRFRHNPSENLVIWETSPDGLDWTAQHGTAPSVGTDALYVELAAGSTTESEPAGTAQFDDVYLGPKPQP